MPKQLTGRKPKGNLVKEIDAAIAMLTRIRVLANSDKAVSVTASAKAPSAKAAKRVLSADAREAIASAQRKRWAKVRRQKRQAERAAQAK